MTFSMNTMDAQDSLPSPNGPRLRALIFDVDGTLADTEELHRRAFNAAFREFGLEWHWSPQVYKNLLSVSGGRERIEHFAKSIGHPYTDDVELRRFAVALHAAKTARYGRFLTHLRVPLRTGVWRLLNEARRAGLALAIATSTVRSNVSGLLDPSLPGGCTAWFDVIVTADEVEAKKPSPAVYHLALAQLGLPAEMCLAFEDTLNGYRAALDAGIDTIVTTHAYTRGEDFGGALRVLDSLGEPGYPCLAVTADPGEAQFVDMELLRRIHNRALSANARPKIVVHGSSCRPLSPSEATPLTSTR